MRERSSDCLFRSTSVASMSVRCSEGSKEFFLLDIHRNTNSPRFSRSTANYRRILTVHSKEVTPGSPRVIDLSKKCKSDPSFLSFSGPDYSGGSLLFFGTFLQLFHPTGMAHREIYVALWRYLCHSHGLNFGFGCARSDETVHLV